MANGKMLGVKPRKISGGSVSVVELPMLSPDRVTGVTSPLAMAVRRLRRSATALVGVVIVAVLLLVALFADVLAPQSPISSDQAHTFERPSWDHPFGTDQLG